MSTTETYFPPVNKPDTQRYLGLAVLKREGYFTDYVTGEAFRGDLVDKIAQIIRGQSRFKKVNDKLRQAAMDIISMYEKERC